jgi:hypothetical protein
MMCLHRSGCAVKRTVTIGLIKVILAAVRNFVFQTVRGVILCFVSLVGGNSAAATLVIDDFSKGPVAMQATNFDGQTVVQTGLPQSSVLSGRRSVHVGSLGLASLAVNTNLGQLTFLANSDFGYLTLDWGSAGGLLNLSAGGNDRFVLSFLNVTPGWNAAFFDLGVRSGGVQYNYDFSRDLINAVQADGSATVEIPFSRFAGANLAQVSTIEISGARVLSTTGFAIDSINIVPEPSPSAVLSAGMVLTLFVSRVARISRLPFRQKNRTLRPRAQPE